jgi:hypothetical protein
MSFRTDLRTSFWAEVRHQATHPAAVTKPGAPFEEAVGIYRALVKANLPARPGDLALAASQVLIGSSRLMRPWWRIRRRCELFGPLDQFTATYGRYLREQSLLTVCRFLRSSVGTTRSWTIVRRALGD